MKTKDDVRRLINNFFNDFSEPVKDLTSVNHGDVISGYRIYDRMVEVEYQEDIIKFYRVFFTSKGEVKKREFVNELSHDGQIFCNHVGNGQPVQYVNDELIENLFKDCLSLGIAVRY